MSSCCQAKRTRRKAKLDPRYASMRGKSAEVMARRLRAKVEKAKQIAQGKK